jgi:hypothetical protein
MWASIDGGEVVRCEGAEVEMTTKAGDQGY